MDNAIVLTVALVLGLACIWAGVYSEHPLIVNGLLGRRGGKKYADLPFYTAWEAHDNQVAVSGKSHTKLRANTRKLSSANYLAGVYVLDVLLQKRGQFRLFFVPQNASGRFPNARVRPYHFEVVGADKFALPHAVKNVWVLAPVDVVGLTGCIQQASNMDELAKCASSILGVDVDVAAHPVPAPAVRLTASVIIPAGRVDDLTDCLNAQPDIVATRALATPDVALTGEQQKGRILRDVEITMLLHALATNKGEAATKQMGRQIAKCLEHMGDASSRLRIKDAREVEYTPVRLFPDGE